MITKLLNLFRPLSYADLLESYIASRSPSSAAEIEALVRNFDRNYHKHY
jgi:hypothetical protein